MIEAIIGALGGAIITVALTKVFECIGHLRRRRSLYVAILAECQHDICVVDQMLNGMLTGATFKRISVEFFKELRLEAVQYALDKSTLQKLSNLIVDIELYNREAESVYECAKRTAGNNLDLQSLRQTVNAAHKGVTESLKSVVSSICVKLGEDASDED